MKGSIDANGVVLQLTRSEALVLFEWLSSEDPRPGYKTSAQPSAELTLLWLLEGALESLLPEPFEGNYAEVVQRARECIIAAGNDLGGDE